MNFNSKKIVAMAATMLLSIVGVGVVSSPAYAACDSQWPAEDQTANDNPKVQIRLVSPVLSGTNSIVRDDLSTNFEECGWFGNGVTFKQVYVPFGLKTYLTYRVTTATGVPLVNKEITLRANKGYSSSNALVTVNGVTAKKGTGPAGPATDGANVKSKTDANGYVTFVVGSPTDCSEFGTLPDAPATLTTKTPSDANNDPLTDCFSQFIPSSSPDASTEKSDSQDFVELHYYNSAGLTYSATAPTLSLVAPLLDDSNSISSTGLVQTYAAIGSKQNIVFKATEGGLPARNLPVTVRINLANSGANAKISAGIFGTNGTATLSNTSVATTEDQLVLNGTTDAFGIVAFTLNNTDTVGEPIPATKTSPVPTTGAVFAKITAELTGIVGTSSALEVHYFKPAPIVIPPTSITATASGKKITVTLNNTAGKTYTVTITGLKKISSKKTVTVNLKKVVSKTSVSKKLLYYTVPAGKTTVKIVVNGKTLTKVFTIK